AMAQQNLLSPANLPLLQDVAQFFVVHGGKLFQSAVEVLFLIDAKAGNDLDDMEKHDLAVTPAGQLAGHFYSASMFVRQVDRQQNFLEHGVILIAGISHSELSNSQNRSQSSKIVTLELFRPAPALTEGPSVCNAAHSGLIVTIGHEYTAAEAGAVESD